MPQQLPQILILAFLLLLVTERFQQHLSCFEQWLPIRNEIAETPRHVGKWACSAWIACAGSCWSDRTQWEPAPAFQSWVWISSEKYQVGACGQLQANGCENSPKLHFSSLERIISFFISVHSVLAWPL